MVAGKTPGPDGLPQEFYASYQDTLIPHLLDVYQEATDRGSFLPEIDMATIVVIPKSQPPSRHCPDYRLISLINSELKIFASVLANRIRPHLSKLVHPDQCGFMPSRGTRHCLRCLHLALANRHLLTPYLSLLLVDFEKAFDLVDWRYLEAVLMEMGFGDSFCTMVRSLYCRAMARVLVNGTLSDPFPISSGTRQGCPLSPLLFVLAMEPFACEI